MDTKVEIAASDRKLYVELQLGIALQSWVYWQGSSQEKDSSQGDKCCF